MNNKNLSLIAAISGLTGVCLLITSFVINNPPPGHPDLQQLIEYGRQNYQAIVWGAWLQAVSPCMIIFFALTIVHLAGASNKLSGWMTFFGAVILMVTSMIEITFYFSAVNGKTEVTGVASLDLISGVQHLYSMIAAPVFFSCLSYVIIRSYILPRFLGYSGFALALLFFILGIIALTHPIQYIIDKVSFARGIWWFSAAIALLLKRKSISN